MMREPAFRRLPRPAPVALAGKRVLVLGLGDTGLSVARWVEREGGRVRVADTREAPPRRNAYAGELRIGPFAPALLHGVDLVCVSPGLALDEPLVREAMARGLAVLGDIELFAWHVRREARSKVAAVTGTNGKSTVTALTGHLLQSAGMEVALAGNIGPAALDALAARATCPAAWVLELSSYQLETTWSLEPEAATMLNLSEDHFDRYSSLSEYGEAKARVFMGRGVQVLNRDDPHSMALALPGRERITFGLGVPPGAADFGVRGGQLVQGSGALLPVSDLGLHGGHNVANALAACALACALGVPAVRLVEGLKSFSGLPHRLQRIAVRCGVEWYDDSKGTNVGATIAALRGLGRKAVLIAGGDGKGQDFSPLAPAVAERASRVLLIGRDASRIEAVLSAVPTERCESLEAAVARAAEIAQPGDAVLLSPACASWDMFRDYRHRGEVFAAAVEALGLATEGPDS